MNVLAEVRKQVVTKGKLRFGAASRLAAILGVSHDQVRRALIGSDRGRYLMLTPEQERKLLTALKEERPLYRIVAMKQECSHCGGEAYAKGLCKSEYYRQWRASLSSVK